jgi:hypothetical protein
MNISNAEIDGNGTPSALAGDEMRMRFEVSRDGCLPDTDHFAAQEDGRF